MRAVASFSLLAGAFFVPPALQPAPRYANPGVNAMPVAVPMVVTEAPQAQASAEWVLPAGAVVAGAAVAMLAVSAVRGQQGRVAALAVSADARPSEKVLKLADEMGSLTLLEASDLVEKLQDMFGLPDQMAMPMGMPMAMPGGGDAGGAPAEAAKTTVDLKITAMDASSKIKLIKEVRAIAGLGLKESKEFVEGLPKVLKEGLEKDAAEELKATLEAAGGTVELV
jgi:large subunit ribosomal protein L7/L12